MDSSDTGQLGKRLEQEKKGTELEAASGPVLSVQEAARYMRVSTQTIYDDAATDRIPHVRRGKRILVHRHLLDAMLLHEALMRWNHPAAATALCARCREALKKDAA